MPKITLGVYGQLAVGGKVVEADFTITPGSETKGLTGRLKLKDGGGIELADLIKAILPSLPALPVSSQIKDILFASAQKGQESKYLFALDIGTKLDLTDLPLAGPMVRKALPSGQQLGLDGFQLLVTSKGFSKEDIKWLQAALPGDPSQSPLPEQLASGFNIAALGSFGDKKIELSLPPVVDSSAQEQKAGEPQREQAKTETPPPGAGDKTKWIELKKSFGPVTLERIGFQFADGTVLCLVDASRSLAGLTFSAYGRGGGLQLKEKKPVFHLDGLGLSFAKPPIEISGGLLVVSRSPLRLDGALQVRIADLGIAALGSYADLDGQPSLFAFAVLNAELGGPAFFFITGLAFGFGINRQLKLPDISEVHNYPLIRAATDPTYLGEKLDLRVVSQKLTQYLAPLAGNFWIAAGIKFTSFRQIDSFALLSVSFGTKLQVALLGLSKIQIPKPPAPTIAFAELALKVVFDPEAGLLSVEARLTENSYILRKDFILRGGFAFYSWFAGDHAGDFVVSLGGYHPRFLPPSHYPKPDLVQFYCKTGDVTIQGSCYFAFCPSAIMAGGTLSMVYQAGGIRAWFIAYANFLVQWKPLHYDIEIGISVGVKLSLDIGITRINISVELGASVSLYGPPLGGSARISLAVVTFTVHFGESKQLPPPMLWESGNSEKSFAKSFLMNPDVTRVLLSDGLLEEVKHGNETTRFANPHRLLISCGTQTPATDLLFNGHDAARFNEPDPGQIQGVKVNGKVPGKKPWWNEKIGVRPMDRSSCYSLLDVKFGPRVTASAERTQKMRQYLDQFVEISLVTGQVPRALWDPARLDTRAPAQSQMLENALLGLQIKTKEGPRPWETPALDLKVLKYDRFDRLCDFATVVPRDSLPAGRGGISKTIGEVSGRRNAILQVLRETGRKIMKPEEVRVQNLQANARYIFQATPLLARPGQYPPRDLLDI